MRKKIDPDNPISEVYNVPVFTFLYPTFFRMPLTREPRGCIYFLWDLFEMKCAVENNPRFMKFGSSAVGTLHESLGYPSVWSKPQRPTEEESCSELNVEGY